MTAATMSSEGPGLPAPSQVPASLARGRELTTPALRAAVDGLSPQMRLVSGYHLGWLAADGSAMPGSGGKAVRPALAVLSAEAAGAPGEVGVPGGVAVELVHNFSLLHDDLMDGDTERRHRATAWTAFSPSLAILAGDALLALAQQALLEVGNDRGLAAARRLGIATQDLITGQVDDLAFESRSHVGVDEVLAMAAGKTGALLACAASIGAELAGAPAALVDGLAAYGAHLGLAFQLVDDLLGIWGDPSVTGKPVLSDLRSRKKSVPVVVAVNAGGSAAQELARMLGDERPHDEDDLVRMAGLVEEAGGRAWTVTEARRQLDEALSRLRLLDMPDPVRDELGTVARFVTTRES